MTKILCFMLATLMIISGFSVSASETENERIFSDEYYRPRVQSAFRRLGTEYQEYFDCEDEYSYYYEVMAYKPNGTVEYTLIFPTQVGLPREGYDKIDKYVLNFANYYDPYTIGYYVYIPSDDKVYTLTEAYEMNVTGLSEAFEVLIEKGMCAIAGDANMDGELNIKDATRIQKQIAGLVSSDAFLDSGVYHVLYYGIEDFNLDKKINVKDATAIQKYIAGITE